jgi:hypothetical protein
LLHVPLAEAGFQTLEDISETVTSVDPAIFNRQMTCQILKISGAIIFPNEQWQDISGRVRAKTSALNVIREKGCLPKSGWPKDKQVARPLINCATFRNAQAAVYPIQQSTTPLHSFGVVPELHLWEIQIVCD